MKKLTTLVLALAMLLCGFAAFAEADAANGTQINCLIEDGSYIIQIDDPEGDMGWVADDMAQDPSVVTLYDADLIEDTFVVRYDAVGDGDVTVGVRHYTGIACDQMFTWDLHVADGAVQEATGGSHAAAPADEELDSALLGQWLEKDTQFNIMTVEKNPERGWDVEIVSPATHGAYVFKTTVYYDCELDALVYDKGKYWDVPITDSDEPQELGEAKVAGTTGRFVLTADDGETLELSWYDDQRPEEEIVFARSNTAAVKCVAPMPYEIDLEYVVDGIYPVSFEPDALIDGALTLSLYTEDVYDIVDIATLEVGDSIIIDGSVVEVKSLERDECVRINGGNDGEGFDLWPYDEDNCYKVVQDDDYHTFTRQGDVTLPLDDAVIFTDAWDLDAEPVTAEGIDAVSAAITGSDNDIFSVYNATVQVADGRIVAISRTYMP